jgi:competence protein ComEC
MKRPLVGVAGAFLLGIAAASRLDLPAGPLLGALGFLLAVAGALIRRRQAAAGWALLLTAALGGACRYTWAVQQAGREALRPYFGAAVRLAGVVVDEPRLQGERWHLVLESRLVQVLPSQRGRSQPNPPEVAGRSRARSRVYLVAPDLSGIAFGDWICVTGRLQAPSGATNPGQFSFRRYLAQRRLRACLFVAPGDRLQRCDGDQGAWLPTWTVRLRQALTERIERHMPGPYGELTAQLLNSLVFGLAAAPLPPDLESHFRRAGVVHILVASGTQVSLLILFLILLREPSRSRGGRAALAWGERAARRWPRLQEAFSRGQQHPLGRPRLGCGYSLLVAGVVGGYALIAGAQASIVRAAWMGGLLLLAHATARDFDALTALAAAALALLLANPLDLFSPSFQLSFAAVLGLILLGPPLSHRLSARWPGPLAWPLAFSAAAQLAVAPILACEFHQVSLVGFLANLPVVPIAGLLVATGLAASLLGGIGGPLTTGLHAFNHGLVHGIVRITCFFSEIPGGFIWIPAFSWTHLTLGYAALAVWTLGLSGHLRFRRERGVVYGLLLLSGFMVWQAGRSLNPTLRVTFLDVGNGDAILVQAPSGRTMLIDGGPYRPGPPAYDAGERVVVPALLALGVSHLDVVVATHLQADHIGGLPAVLRAVPVSCLLLSEAAEETAVADRLRATAQQQGVPIRPARRGQTINLGRGLRAYVLWPLASPLRGTGSDVNNNAVVLKLVYGRVSFLLTGDIGAAAERELLQRTGHLASTVLKVAHHGSEGSTTPEFLQAVRPRIAVISVGSEPERGVTPLHRTNLYGHPSRLVQQRLRQIGAHLYRTDLEGAITVRTNGCTVWVSSHGER